MLQLCCVVRRRGKCGSVVRDTCKCEPAASCRGMSTAGVAASEPTLWLASFLAFVSVPTWVMHIGRVMLLGRVLLNTDNPLLIESVCLLWICGVCLCHNSPLGACCAAAYCPVAGFLSQQHAVGPSVVYDAGMSG